MILDSNGLPFSGEQKPLDPNAVPVITDLVQGDDSVAGTNFFSTLDAADIAEAVTLISRNPNLSEEQKRYFLMNSWRIHYRTKPPTIDEFLTEQWIGPQANSLFVHAKRILKEYWSPTSPFRTKILGTAIGTGKSTISTVDNLYITTHLWCMRNPKTFFGLAPSTSIVQALISFSMDKAKQLLLQPFMQILLTSPKFRRVKQEEHLVKRQKEYPNDICWTTASRVGILQFPQDIHYIVASGPHQILGLNMIAATLSEISFFIDRGFSPDYIWRIFQDSKARIQNRFGKRYFTSTILDSSPNDMEASPIDRYIFSGEAAKDPSNYIVTGSHWELFAEDPQKLKEKYPIYAKTGQTFPVFRGSNSEPPRMLQADTEIEQYSPTEVYNVPVDIKQLFEDACTKNVKDYCGWPAGSQDKLIRETYLIEKMFTPRLRNFPTFVMAPSDKVAEGQLWNLVKDRFFIEVGPGRKEFYRAPREKRWIHFDQAETGDMASIVMSHPEWDLKNSQIVVVHDFTIAISPGKGRINLDALRLFPEALRDKGHLNIEKITFDQFQSSTTIQYLKGKGFNVERLSVDADTKPYLTYVSLINTGRVKSGRNIFLKNNLKCIQEVKTESGRKKIDHTIGKLVYDDGGAWFTSLMGTNAKDVSDSCAGSAYGIILDYHGVPRYTWDPAMDSTEEEREEFMTSALSSEGLTTSTATVDRIRSSLRKEIEDKFHLTVKR